ncbi:hypothetical protein HY489_03250 [Candidatus Woesearchaeota archaeon]|nr:hypothetical protein [Candidatus Woesearchaeota archaeon]
MARRRSIVMRGIIGLGKGIGLTVVYSFKAVWWLVKGIGLGIRAGFSAVSGKVSEAREQSRIEVEQPKTPASYSPLSVVSAKKGALEHFERRLLNESLILAIAGRRGSGKSVLGFRLLENIHYKARRPCFALGVKQSVLPSWIKSIEDIQQVSNGGVVLVDEGAISFSSRESMSKENRGLGGLLAIARHKDLSLIFITQNTGMIDKNVLNLCDTILLKEGSLLQEKMERSVMKDLYTTANSALSEIDAQARRSHCYVFDAEFEGLVSASLPGFWSSKVSKNQA